VPTGHAEWLSAHLRLSQYQTVMGTIIANQLQSSIRNTVLSQAWFGDSVDHGAQ